MADDAAPLPLNEAIAAAMTGRLNQRQLAAALGYRPPSVNQWLVGTSIPKLRDIPRIEDACGRPRGFIFHAAGYCGTGEQGFLAALEREPGLDDVGKEMIRAAYEAGKAFYRQRYPNGAGDGSGE